MKYTRGKILFMVAALFLVLGIWGMLLAYVMDWIGQ